MSRRGRIALRIAAGILAAGATALAAWRGEDGLALAIAVLGLVTVPALSAAGTPPWRPRPSEEKVRGRGWEGLIEAHPDPTLAVDIHEVVMAANGPAHAILPGLRVGHPLALALRAPRVLEGLRRTVRDGTARTVALPGRLATEPSHEVRLRAVTTPDGTAVALFFRDVSAERHLETMRSDFVATVSHELRTPLASLSGFIDTLQGPARDDAPARIRFLAIMREQADRMRRLVDDLLQLSRVEMKAHLPPTEVVDLGPIVGHMVEVLAPLAREGGATVAVQHEGGPLMVAGDRDELLRVVENLVENAVKYGGRGRVEVTLGPGPGGRGAELAVRDEGPGIAPEHLPRLTERFYRVDAVESRSRGGTGLGLAIVKHIVSRHRGRIAIESEIGRGTTVRVVLPGPPAAGDGGHGPDLTLS